MMRAITDWARFTKLCLPSNLRSAPTLLAWLTLLCSHSKQVYLGVIQLSGYLKVEFGGSGQRLVLEQMLKAEMATPNLRVVLLDNQPEELAIYTHSNMTELVEVFEHATMSPDEEAATPVLYDHSYTQSPDFKIQIPAAVYGSWSTSTIRRLHELVSRYKVYGSTYDIELT